MAVDLRDFQKSKVYDAEDVVWGALSNTLKHFTTEDNIIKWINKILGYKRVEQAFPEILNGPDIEIGVCNRSTWSEADCDRIKFASKNNTPIHAFLIVHELAHVLQYWRYDGHRVSAHGPEFCRIYLTLTRIVLGKEAYYLLKDSFDDHNVKY